MATANPPYIIGPTVDRHVERARKVARVLDGYFVDPILGLVLPGAGDVIGSVFGLYIVGIAVHRGMSPVVIARMIMNLAVDALVGSVPLLGDVVDVAWKANTRNLELLEQRAVSGGGATSRDWLAVGGAALLFGAAVGLSIFVIVAILHALS